MTASDRRRATITDVARRAGTSKGTVSMVLNDRPGVAPATRARVVAAVQDLGFRPSGAARALSLSRADAIGLVLARVPATLRSDSFYAPFVAGLEQGVGHADCAVLLRFVADEAAEAAAYRALAEGRRVDGVVLADLRCDDPRVDLLADLGLPTVTLNRPDVPSSAPAVCHDDVGAVEQVVAHLAALGHRRTAYVGGPLRYLHARRRRDAWRRATRDHGLAPGVEVSADFTAEGGARATHELLDLRPAQRPTAVVYGNDTMAVAGTVVAQHRGLVLPRDLSVVGFDDGELSAYVRPSLTTVRTDPFAWGEQAARTLVDLVHLGPDHAAVPTDVHLDAPRLVVRDSTAPPAAHPIEETR
ncbi:LacI family DNA-binding transcriptional regulator [Cellulomonas triticagri]|uniref:LacI family transcriptional regulator n=1 Tax=Cellulomonas triticagri TaxID=2483352 RepID=A0A3M2IY56_9CELL|nr:LacI family DNA-binding transcriptional regulator [Cellulomonas triticagri]RMI03745.1 LacI family transcriptional regulator [Cellulomonas triticagri]